MDVQPKIKTDGLDQGEQREQILAGFRAVRDRSMQLAAPLSVED